MSTAKMRYIIIFISALIFALIGLPIFSWLNMLIGNTAWLFLLFWILSSMSLPLSYNVTSVKVKILLHRIGEAWFSIALYLALAFISKSLLLCIFRQIGFNILYTHIMLGWCALAVFFICILSGAVNALKIKTVHIEQNVKIQKSCRIVLFSDLHLGVFTGKKMLKRIVEASNREKPDIVLIAGDFFDMEFDSLRNSKEQQQILSQLKSKYGIFACLGNHDLLYTDSRKEDWITKCGIRILRDEYVDVCEMILVGRRDITDPKRRPLKEIIGEQNHPLIVLDHNPANSQEACECGAFFILCGHTHGGQTFPGNLLQKILKEKPIYGLHNRAGAHLFVTSGAGFWGLPIRLFVNNEIICIDLKAESV